MLRRRLRVLLIVAPLVREAGMMAFAYEQTGHPVYASLAILLDLPEAYFDLGPLVATLAVGALPMTVAGLRRAGRVVLVATVAMVVIDHFVVPTATELSSAMAGRLPGQWPNLVGDVADPYEVRGTGPALMSAVLADGPMPGREESRDFMVARGLARLAWYAYVPLFVGILWGAWSLVLRAVAIPDPEDRHRLTRLASWVVVPLSFFILAQWTGELRGRTAFGGNPWMTIIPLVPVGILAWAGWRSAKRYIGWAPNIPPGPLPPQAPSARV